MWIRKISNRGDSICITLPRQLCRDLNIERGDFLLMNYDRTGLVSARKLSPQQVDEMNVKGTKKVPTIR